MKKIIPFLLSLNLISLLSWSQIVCGDGFIQQPDTTVCKGSFVTINALGSRNHHSIHLDGVNDYMHVFNSNALDVDTALTVECWFKPDTVDFMYIISKGPDTTTGWYGLGRFPQNVSSGQSFLESGLKKILYPLHQLYRLHQWVPVLMDGITSAEHSTTI